tara:strand:+ start:414 stop:1766 length:1353 start_codon:yes stop_codon:yes gene_type:complete
MLRKLMFAFVVLLITKPTLAVLELEITDGNIGAIPISVLPFEVNGDGIVPENIALVINEDLRRSGRFRPISGTDMPQKTTQEADLDYKKWRKAGVEAIVVGSILPMGTNYQVEFRLIDVFKASSGAVSDPFELSNGELVSLRGKRHVIGGFKGVVPETELRRHGHRIADYIYEKLTGQKGAFLTRIAYVRVENSSAKPYKLIVADYDGHNDVAILKSKEPVMSPSWSPDSKKLAYVSFETGKPAIYVHDLQAGQRKKVTDYPGINGAPAWDSTGTKLALVLSKDGNAEIYSYDLTNNKLQRLTKHWAIDTEPSWGPDDKSLVFTSDRGGRPQIYRLHLSDNRIERLTFEGDYNAGASLSEDGMQMVMVHRLNGVFHIAVQDLQSGYVQILTKTQLDESPSIAPNGSMIIYSTLYNGRKSLAWVSVDGNFKAVSPQSSGDSRAPSWSDYLK